MYRTKNVFKFLTSRCYSSKSSSNVIEHLKGRTLLRVSGNEVSDYLQGLITNDIHHLDHGDGCMYTMFLNTKGRVLYDAVIYNTDDANTFYIDCDAEASESLQKHLKLYKIRRKIDVASLRDEYKIFALFDLDVANRKGKESLSSIDGVIVPCDSLKETAPKGIKSRKTYKDLNIYQDPRTTLLGSRILTKHDVDVKGQLSEIYSIGDSKESFRWYRYNLGVGEGIVDLPPGNCFPLEANCDYLHGVSFHKGCYIGQEVTARTHHTGVVRKRLMPLRFNKSVKLPENLTIQHNKVNLGKLRGIEGDSGLALLRIAQTLELKEINVGDGTAQTEKPVWWPLEASKEKISAQKN